MRYAACNRQHIYFILTIIFIIIIRQIYHMLFAIPSMAHLAVVIQLIMLLYHWTFAAMSLVAMMTAQALTQPWMVIAGRTYQKVAHSIQLKIRPVVLLTRMRKDIYFGMFMTVNHVTVV
jgi:hypothetical protein